MKESCCALFATWLQNGVVFDAGLQVIWEGQ